MRTAPLPSTQTAMAMAMIGQPVEAAIPTGDQAAVAGEGSVPAGRPRGRGVTDLPGSSNRHLATSCGRSEWWVLQHAGPVLDQLGAAVEGAVVDHVEGDVGIAVVDAF
jgi:hypothetical protein